jgi:hypothetical protein
MNRSHRHKFLLAGALALLLPVGNPARAQDDSVDPATQTPDSGARRGSVIMRYNEEVPMGTHRVKDKDGREVIIYSTGGPSKRSQIIRESAREDRDQAWEMLSTIIIDTRSGRDRADD